MGHDADPPLSAEVVLRPPRGRLSDYGPITSANLDRVMPSDAAVATAVRFFRDQGFDVGPQRGISFSIAGRRSVFERTLGGPVPLTGESHIGLDEGALELPLDHLPADVADVIEAVTFTPPPDYGPPAV